MTEAKRLSSNFTIKLHERSKNNYVITVPVFGVKTAWDALRVANKKLEQKNSGELTSIKSVSVNPTLQNLYICVFTFNSKCEKTELVKLLKWGIYEA